LGHNFLVFLGDSAAITFKKQVVMTQNPSRYKCRLFKSNYLWLNTVFKTALQIFKISKMKLLFFFTSMLFSMTATGHQTNYHFSHTDSTRVSSDKIWQVWTDVPNWKQWDQGLKEAVLDGNFIVGTKGKLIPNKGPKSKFIISELVPNKSYAFKTRIPLGWLVIKRTLEVKNGITYFTHDVEFTGLLKKVFGNVLGKEYRAMLPNVLSEIKRIAEQQ
jgi:hypothetical protein